MTRLELLKSLMARWPASHWVLWRQNFVTRG